MKQRSEWNKLSKEFFNLLTHVLYFSGDEIHFLSNAMHVHRADPVALVRSSCSIIKTNARLMFGDVAAIQEKIKKKRQRNC